MSQLCHSAPARPTGSTAGRPSPADSCIRRTFSAPQVTAPPERLSRNRHRCATGRDAARAPAPSRSLTHADGASSRSAGRRPRLQNEEARVGAPGPLTPAAGDPFGGVFVDVQFMDSFHVRPDVATSPRPRTRHPRRHYPPPRRAWTVNGQAPVAVLAVRRTVDQHGKQQASGSRRLEMENEILEPATVRVLDDFLAAASVVLELVGCGACQPRPDRAMTSVMLIRTAVKPPCTNVSAKSSAGWEG
jgi:hypothetical protein